MSTLIRCQNLNKQFAANHALKDVSFEVSAGQPVALVGPNGAGKSTLFSLICGFMSPSSGSIEVLGLQPGSAQLRGKVGALPQDALFDPDLTIADQLVFLAQLQVFSSRAAKKEMQKVLELMGLTDKQQALPTALSHGMKKRLSIAQALIGDPQLILLDEPTAGLDPENARNIRQRIRELADHTTFIISSHNLNELERLCQQVLVLNQGQLQHDENIQQQASGKITLRLWQENEAIAGVIQQLAGVIAVEKQREELFIDYDMANTPTLDQQLLKLLAEKNVSYRQLTHGQSLEQRLFN